MRAEIRQRDENFVPRVVAVTVGSTVDFPNDDPIYHNVFSLVAHQDVRPRTLSEGQEPRRAFRQGRAS